MAKIEKPWLVHAYQHGCKDTCEEAASFASETEALAPPARGPELMPELSSDG